jgi:AcrR family transcriptional regulator
MGLMVNIQVVLRGQSGSPPAGLRSRKKAKTRLAIEDAALTLFEGQGYDATTVEEIAERAEVSVTTFFRYFPTKAEVLLSDHGEQLPALHRAIVERPQGEDDLLAIQRAVQLEWVAAIDPEQTARKTRVVDRSDQLVGMSYHRGHRWYATVTEALARRRGLEVPDDGCAVTARVALGILASAVEGWMAAGCLGDLAEAVDRQFALAKRLCAEWSRSTHTQD